jgi:tellurite resistance protein TerC
MVWALIMSRFNVPARHRRRVLAAGIGVAVVLRVAAIEVGANALDHCAWLTYALGALLIYTGIRVAARDDDSPGIAARLARLKVSPALVAALALGATDLMFAVDSIPASFGITRDPATIIIANGVALIALWSMYGAVAALLARLRYLQHGLAVVLAWIGVTMLAADVVHVGELANLAVIAAILGASAAASIVCVDTFRSGVAE